MADSFTEGLRRAAPRWSLAGDQQLLDVLQGLHQKIIEKCQETNNNLEKMVSALDEASIHLQNVNNKFTALSNSQFIESRVYDDDGEDATEPEKPKVQNEPQDMSELEKINRSLQVLERMHESVTILCDSDSQSGTDDEDITRVVLKPKDLYADRPLPYIIGSKAWKAKWHAGLLHDESDSDSASVKETANNEEYSDSEPEPISDSPRPYKPHARHSPQWMSSGSDLESEQDSRSHNDSAPPSQSDVAAELARRLGGGTVKLPDAEPEPLPPSSTVRKLYKPHQPTPGNLFLDEPPPIDSDQSEDTDDDIFAEINKKQPYRQSTKADSSVADDLFGRPVFDEIPSVIPPAKQKQLLFEDESEPELFVSEPRPALESKKEQDVGIKKPVGAMSLFGSNANAESIGAAILKRNQRQSSTSGGESDQEPTQTTHNIVEASNNRRKERDVKTQKEKERDIFDDLFAKSEKNNKDKSKNSIKEGRNDKEHFKKPEKKLDLFSDNIFDDIDDIFTTNVKVVAKDDKKQQKSIFDDDDLFAEVSETVKPKIDTSKTVSKSKKDIFGDENDIFADKSPENQNKSQDNVLNKSSKETKSLFDDSDDALFSNADKTNTNVTMSVNMMKSETASNIVSETVKIENIEKSLLSDDEDLFHTGMLSIEKRNINKDAPKKSTKDNKTNIEKLKHPDKVVMSPDIFDEDDDGLFLFQSTQSVSKTRQDSGKTSQNRDDLFDDKKPVTAKDVQRESTTPHTDSNSKENVIPISTESIFGDENTEDDIFSKSLNLEKTDVDNIKDLKEVSANKPTKVQVKKNQVDDTETFNKPDKTVIETTVRKIKPDISEKPVTVDITVINTKITRVSNSDIAPLASQDATTTDTTITDTKITITPDIINSVTAAVNEVKVSTKPGIAQKPIAAKKPIQNKELPPENYKPTITDNVKEVDANKNITDSIFQDINSGNVPITNEEETVNTHDTKTDLFSDIFNDLPPVFEKPKERKKSKNVNALFDDDSDDEQLFFKKNDVIPDERPEGFVSSDDKLFGLFRDEPPAIDVDFVQKSSKTDRLQQSDKGISQKENLLSHPDQNTIQTNTAGHEDTKGEKATKLYDDNDDDIFGKKTTKIGSDDLDKNSNTEDLFSKVTGDIFKKPSIEDDDDLFKTVKTGDSESSFKEEILVSLEKSLEEKLDIDNASAEPKKVGKLKPMNFNINVNTLLPGASPKKVVKSSDNTDGQTSSRGNDELIYNEDAEIKNTETESTVAKTVSFDGNPDSPVLNNKLSKERAKIQVKRRPSTRKARREAVKKSGIDFGEDSTDNSSSIDDQCKSSKEIPDNENISVRNETEDLKNNVTSEQNVSNIEEDTNINIVNVTSENQDADRDALVCKTKSIFDSDEEFNKSEDMKEEIKTDTNSEQNNSSENTNDVKNVKSKVVYILNDEDIFDTKPDHKSEISQSSFKTIDNTKPESMFDDPDDLFKSVAKNDGIATLGQVYKESKPKTQKLDFLSDSDDDNLFKSSKTAKEIKPVEKKLQSADMNQVEVKNVTLKSKTKRTSFDGSVDNLFQDNSKKPSLFGSDSDEELFSGVKKEKEVPQKKQEPKKEEIRKNVTKASLFEEDDDDDLFGVKTKKNKEPKRQATKATSSREINKHPEPVFADPLSLLGSDED